MRPGFHARPSADHSAAAVRAAGNAAYGALCRAAAWSAERLTDGFVPRDVAHRLGPPRSWQRLVEVGLCSSAGDGYRITGFTEGNPAAGAQRVARAAISEVRRLAGRSGGLQSGASRRSKSKLIASSTSASPAETPLDPEAKRSKQRRAPQGEPERRALARNVLRPDEAAAWRLWEAMQRIPALLAAEDADTTVAPGSLARLALGLVRRLESRRAPVAVWLDVAAQLAVLLDVNEPVPPMAAVSRRVGEMLAELLPGPARVAPAAPQPCGDASS